MENKRMNLVFNILMIAFFMIFLILPTINNYVPVFKTIKNNEKRKLSTFPKLSLNKFKKFPKKFNKYYKDNLSFRDNFIQFYSLLILKIFNISPYPDKVMIGKDGWFFYSSKSMVDEYRNVIPFKKKELELIAKNLVERKEWLNKKGIKYYVLIPPNKYTIYPEYYNESIKKINDKSRLEGLLDYLKRETDLIVLDLRDEFLNLKKTSKYRLFQKTDTHWSKFGAFIGCQKLVNIIKIDFPEIKPLELSDFNIKYEKSFGGDLASMIALRKQISVEKIRLYKKGKYRSSLDKEVELQKKFPRIKFVRKKIKHSSLPKAVIFKDSFAGHFIPYLSEHFRAILYVGDPQFNTKIIEHEKPDIVIREVVERLIHILKFKNPDKIRKKNNLRRY